jgi:hypothetical protein
LLDLIGSILTFALFAIFAVSAYFAIDRRLEQGWQKLRRPRDRRGFEVITPSDKRTEGEAKADSRTAAPDD